MEKRMKTAERELKTFKEMGVYKEFVNDNLETCFKEFTEYLSEIYPKNFKNK